MNEAFRESVFRRASTCDVPARDRFDFWRMQFAGMPLERPRAMLGRDFDGNIVATPETGGIRFSSMLVDPANCRFGDEQRGVVLLGRIHHGLVEIDDGHRRVATVGAHSGLMLFDCDRMLGTRSQRYAMDCLALPSKLVRSLLGGAPVSPTDIVRRLQSGPLARTFLQHMRGLAKHGPEYSPADAGKALSVARSMAVALLADHGGHWRSLSTSWDGDLLEAANQELSQHLGDARFTAAQLAAAMGCSRAHLYRLFERHGQTIMGRLRTLRMERALMLLQSHRQQSIASIAVHCGYADLSAFGRAFRRHFGFSAGEARGALSVV